MKGSDMAIFLQEEDSSIQMSGLQFILRKKESVLKENS
jgi:hypothetical protein